MPLWGNVDNAANSDIAAIIQVNKSITTNNRTNLYGNVTPDIYVTGANVGQFGVTAGEMAAANTLVSKPPHAGWVLRTEGSGGRAGRVFYETLVAMGSMSGDGEDVVFPDYRITITRQPSSANIVSGGTGPNTTNLSVEVSSQPSGATLIYHWQRSYPGAAAWANVPNTGVFATAFGNTTNTLGISNTFFLTDNVFRLRVASDDGGVVTVYSSNATINVV